MEQCIFHLYIKVCIREFGLKFFFFSSQRELHSVGNIDFLVGAPTSICHFFRVSVRRAPYLRNCTSSNRIFRYTCVKSYLQGILLFDSFFKIFIFGDVRGLKGQKIDQICHTPYPRNSIAYDHDFWCTCVKDDTSRCFFSLFFIFLKFSFFGMLGG